MQVDLTGEHFTTIYIYTTWNFVFPSKILFSKVSDGTFPCRVSIDAEDFFLRGGDLDGVIQMTLTSFNQDVCVTV